MKDSKINKIIWSTSWKNVWRNHKRSLVVIFSVTIGVVAGVFTSGLMEGWIDQSVRAAIHTEMGHAKLRTENYILNEEIQYTIQDKEKIFKTLNNDKNITAWSSRFKIMSMAQTSRGNTALMLNAVDVENEKKVTDIYKKIVANGGEFLNDEFEKPIVISDKTAEILRVKNYEINDNVIDSLQKSGVPSSITDKLQTIKDERFKTEKLFKKAASSLLTSNEAKKYGSEITKFSKHYRLRSKIIFTFNGSDGQTYTQTYKVCGVYKTSNTMFDQANAYVLKKDLIPVLGYAENDCHEISVILNEEVDPREFCNKIRGEYSGMSAMTWEDLAPDASMYSEFIYVFNFIIMLFILFALAFGIINTMLMAVLERTKELGMLMAIGMNKRRVFYMIMLETIFLTLVGAVIGMILGYITVAITGHTGLNFTSIGEGFEAWGWPSLVYPRIDPFFFILVTVMVIITGILASIVPARKALQLNPIEAIRTE